MDNEISRILNLLSNAKNTEQKASVCIGLSMTIILNPDYVMRAILIDKFKQVLDKSHLDLDTKEFVKKFLKDDPKELIEYVNKLDVDQSKKYVFIKDIRDVYGYNSN